jgi:cell wall-associated NlpC family hydrolase
MKAKILALAGAILLSMNVGAYAASAATGDDIVNTGEKYLGVPYSYGAVYGNVSSFDCSSFTEYIYAQNGVTLPRVSRDQAKVGTQVSVNNLQKGDLLFFDINRDGVVDHVSIYVSPYYMLGAQSSTGVAFADTHYYWGNYLVQARRVLETQTSVATYTVVSGDTLWGISQKFHTTVSAIQQKNNMTSTTIYVGQKLLLP